MKSLIYAVCIIYFINLFFAAAVVFMERKDPTATFAWVLVLLILPGFGFFFYLLLSQNLYKKKLFTMKIYAKKTFSDYLKCQQEMFSTGGLVYNDENIAVYRDMIKMNLFSSQSSYTQNNDVEIFTDGLDKFDELFRCLENAKYHIHVEYYIIRDDKIGSRLFKILEKKAGEGLEVRLLYDSIGSREIPDSILKKLHEAGVKTASFFSNDKPYLPNFKLNYRNHRKIVVIDGETGFIGGFNVGEEYLGADKDFGYWRDTHIKIRGDAVIDLQTRFFLDWGYASKEDIMYLPKYFPDTKNNGRVGVQIVCSGPDKSDEIIKMNYVKMISSAKKRVYIQTPYFVPDESVMDSIRIAALSGVDVRIMIPCKPDHPFVYWATCCYCGELLQHGIKVYSYENGFMHAKTLIIDGTVSSVGTANFDVRSFRLNFEGNAIIYDTETSSLLEKIFMEDLNFCSEITREIYLERGLKVKFKESISRMFAPLL